MQSQYLPKVASMDRTLAVVSSVALLLSMFLPGAADAKRKKSQAELEAEAAAAEEARYEKVALDIDADGVTDMWNWMLRDGSSSSPARRAFDLNRDGKPDVISHFEGAVLVREEIDADYDGMIDWVDYYEAGRRVRAEWDTDFDSRPDLFKYYDHGVVQRVERDALLPRDGRIDYWEHYRNGMLDVVERDVDGDGRPDGKPEDEPLPTSGE